MQEKEKINKMFQEGKISVSQAKLLTEAVEECQKRAEKIFNEVASQRKSREKKIWGFFSALWSLLVLVAVIASVFITTGKQLGRDTIKALDYFNQASISLEAGDYQEAIQYCKKGVRQAPRFSLGYTLLGASYRLAYEKTKDKSLKQMEQEAFQKATELGGALQRRSNMSTIVLFFTFIFILFILGVISIIVLIFYNSLVRNEEQVNEAWAQVGNACQRKLDLIPALLEVVRDYARHEQQTLQAVIEARSSAQKIIEAFGGIASSDTEKLKKVLELQENVSAGLGKVFALAEKYPELKADAHFLTMQRQLEEAENMIASDRQVYNKQVRVYNSSIKYFPLNLVVTLFHFEPKGYFKID